MTDGENLNDSAALTENDVERKLDDRHPADVWRSLDAIHARDFTDPFDRRLDLRQVAIAETRLLRFVVCDLLKVLGLRRRVKPELHRSN
ncbi:MAG: hypothetical protein M5U09_25535 [Gammaproteobacteria bacterium]|nr:hypothetical protein [Gammaproteobacteria bacterium]